MVIKAIPGLFVTAWLFIILVSAFDGHLFYQNRDVIGHFEQNPLGQLLLVINGGKVWLFLMLKLLGTILTSAILLVIYHRHKPLGLLIALSLASFQFGLLIYLS